MEGTDSDSDSANRATFFSFERSAGDCLKLDYLFIDTHPDLNEETLISIGIFCLRYSEHSISQTIKGIAEQIVGASLNIRKVLMADDRL